MTIKHNEGIHETAAAVGGASFAALGMLVGGPIGGIIGAGIGTPAGRLLSQYANNFLDERATLNDVEKPSLILLRKMLSTDISNSVFQNESDTRLATLDANKILSHSKLIKDNDRRFSPDDYPRLANNYDKNVIKQDLELLHSFGRGFTLNCASIHPLGVGVVKHLEIKLREAGISLKIDYSAISGKDQLLKPESNDFIIMGNDPMFISDNSISKEFRFLFPLYLKNQSIFVKNTNRSVRTSKTYVVVDSSAEVQFRQGIGVARNTELSELGQLETLVQLIDEISPGDGMIVWDPMSEIIRNNQEFTEVPNSKHRIWVSLFAHKSWRAKSRNEVRQAFSRLLLNSWRQCINNRSNLEDLLLIDEYYLKKYELGAGMVLPSFLQVRGGMESD